MQIYVTSFIRSFVGAIYWIDFLTKREFGSYQIFTNLFLIDSLEIKKRKERRERKRKKPDIFNLNSINSVCKPSMQHLVV